jgi:hypothetical protein
MVRQDEHLAGVLKSCRWRPEKKLSARYVMNWRDDFGNKLLVSPKDFEFTEYPLDAKEYSRVTDIYHMFPVNKIISIAKKTYVSVGIDEKDAKPTATIVTHGFDGMLRGFGRIDGEWFKFQPLRFGLDFVKNVLDLPSTYVLDQLFSVIPLTAQVEMFSFVGEPDGKHLKMVSKVLDKRYWRVGE